jgi:two-component system sensor histidine kinase/response regulator
VRVVAFRDLSGRQKIEEERETARKQILLSEGSRKAILESSVDGILIFNENDVIVDANPAAERVFGWVRDEFIGRGVAETVVAPSHRENYRQMLAESRGGGSGFLGRRVKVRAMRWDGSEFDSEVTTTAICKQDGIDFVAAVRDISERMEQQRRIEAALTRMRALVESLQFAIVVLDEDRRVVTANQTFCDLFGQGAEPAAMQGRDSAEISDAYMNFFEDGEAFCSGALRAMEARVPAVPEEFTAVDRRVIERQYVPAMDHGVFQGHLWIYRDVSSHKDAEAQLKGARDAALDSARFKSQFLANMSHEIRTPMNAIVGMTDLLLDTPLNEEQKDFATTVKQASDSLLSLINQILDFSKIEAGKLSLEREDFDLRELIEGVAGMFAARAQAKGIELSVDLAPEVTTLLRGDSGRLGQVLVNLLGNAIKFTEKGDVLLVVSGQDTGRDSVALRIEVRDSGIGIAPEALQHLFKPFVQADGSITRRFGGTGLGLAISKELVELMGGQIGVDSSTVAPRGTRFWVTLCLDRQAEFTRASAAQPGVATLSKLKVLIVDDNSTNCLIVSHQLNAWKVAHGAADSALAAKEVLRQAARDGAPFNLVLLDMQMPDQDGLSLGKDIAQDPQIPTPRMILMSSLGHSPARELLAESAIQACLNKPVKQSSLLRCLQGTAQPESLYAGAQPLKAMASPRREADRREMRVLAAEDNSVNQRVVRSQMQKLGVVVGVVNNGQEALEALESRRYALVLMDCQMPVMDGLAATRELRRREAASGGKERMPVVAMTANALDGDERLCLEAGMDDYLPKPVKLDSLEKVLDRWIPSARPAAQLDHDTHDAMPVFSDEDVRRGMGDSYRQDGVFQELVRLFGEDTPPRLERMEQAAQAGDAATVGKEAHAIKGSCSALGAMRLGHSCRLLEEMGRQGRLEALEAQVRALKDEYQFTLEELLNVSGAPASAA